MQIFLFSPSSEVDLEKKHVDIFWTSKLNMNESEILEKKKHLRQGKQIGSGGYGTVYQTERLSDGRVLACKVINLHETQRRHFTSELNLKLCNHPNLVELVDQFVIDNK